MGHLAIQFAAKSGYNVVALSQSDSKKDLAMKLGAHHYLSGKDVVRGVLNKLSMAPAHLLFILGLCRPSNSRINLVAHD